jgi:hypothetical protein
VLHASLPQELLTRNSSGGGGQFMTSHYGNQMSGTGQLTALQSRDTSARRRVQPTLATAFAKELHQEEATLRGAGAASGWGKAYTEHMVKAATDYLNKDRRLKESQMTEQWYPHLLTPGALISDGGQGIRGAFKFWWPNVPQYGDYAHIYFLFAEGRYLAKNHPMFERILKEIIPEMHTCHTRGAWNMMRNFLAREWMHDKVLLAVHGRLFGPDVNPWFIGIAKVGGCVPSQQVHEVCVTKNSILELYSILELWGSVRTHAAPSTKS